MIDEPTIEFRRVTGRLTDDQVHITVRIHNPASRTLYAYETPRRLRYDAATATILVDLNDEHVDENHPISPHLPQPRFLALEAGTDTLLRITLPRVLNRVRSADERQGQGPLAEQLPLDQAQRISLAIAVQDTPYYYNPREPMAAQLRAWGAQIARTEARISLVRHARRSREGRDPGSPGPTG
jgi:hypothetical protein